MKEIRRSPDELMEEMERRACQERGLVILSVGQWQAITDAYHSPMIERIADSALSVYPVREIETKKLSFSTYCRREDEFLKTTNPIERMQLGKESP
ncbi:unnamed protein product, partial [marine sediment metagenome]